MSMRTKSAAQIQAEIRRLRHQLDRRKLTHVQTELVAARHGIETLRAELRSRTSGAEEVGAGTATDAG